MKDKYLEDLKEIKDIMSRSARFISLSGLSGVSTGIAALAGALAAQHFIFRHHDYLIYSAVAMKDKDQLGLIVIAFATLLSSVALAIFFTARKTKRENQLVWDVQTKRLLVNLAIPLITGGLLCLMFLDRCFVGILPSLTLIFYGLALINAGKYTVPEIRNLGLIEILLGLLAFQFIEYGLAFWAIGFGILQIIYGLIIQKKY